MADHVLVSLPERQAWTDALCGLEHGFQHTWDFAYAMHLTTGYRTFLYCFDDGESRLACPLVERPIDGVLDVATPSGLAGFVGFGAWSRFEAHWHRFVRDRGYVSGYIGLHPLFSPSGFAAQGVRHNSIYLLDLRLGSDGLLSRVDRSRRRELRGWSGRAQSLVQDREAIRDFLVATYEPFMRDVRARGPLFTTQTLDHLCRSESCVAVGTGSLEALDAVYLFAATEYAADCLINVATPAGRRRATDLLWYGVEELSARSVPSLNLGGGAYEDDAIAQAKQRFRPIRLPLRAIRQIYRRDVYVELCQSACVDPEADHAFFPAYRALSPEARACCPE